ncbi:helicase HerA-like domain-containing protein [Mesorhizobium sp. f-mel]
MRRIGYRDLEKGWVGQYSPKCLTQSRIDVPSAMLEQLGKRILHAMRAHTAESLRKIRTAVGYHPAAQGL